MAFQAAGLSKTQAIKLTFFCVIGNLRTLTGKHKDTRLPIGNEFICIKKLNELGDMNNFL